MNRSAKGGARSSLRFDDEGVLIHHRTKVIAGGTVRRTARDLRRTDRVSGWHRISRTISESEVASDALSVVGRLNST